MKSAKKVTKKSTKAIKDQESIAYSKDAVLVTGEGLEQLKQELLELETVGRKRIAERLQEAIALGDLSENAEYQEAKEEQSFMEGRIIDLQRMIKHAQIIKEEHRVGKVNLGSKVDLRNITQGQTESYIIVGSTEVNIWSEPQKISNESPLGSTILGRKKGEVFKVHALSGIFEYEIISVN